MTGKVGDSLVMEPRGPKRPRPSSRVDPIEYSASRARRGLPRTETNIIPPRAIRDASLSFVSDVDSAVDVILSHAQGFDVGGGALFPLPL